MQKKVSKLNNAPVASKGISIGPGSTVGILGGGQLGRMFGIAARRMGYRVHAFEPHPDSPAGQISDLEVNASYGDLAALERFAREVDVISFEFENIPLSAIREVARIRPLRPRGEVLHICQNREREKAFLREHGFPHAPSRWPSHRRVCARRSTLSGRPLCSRQPISDMMERAN
jgi:5-(carboxyamino)imidazole ribonucleotide synthase